MIIDAQNMFSQNQAVTATAASTNSIDTGPLTGTNFGTNLGRDIGEGEGLYLAVMCTVAMTDVGSDSTVTVTIETDADSAFGSPLVTRTIGTFAALSAAGTVIFAKLGIGDINERYVQLRYTVANGNLTTGSFTAVLTKDIQKFVAYAVAYKID